MDNLSAQLKELRADFADDIRRRGDVLLAVAHSLDELSEQILLLAALPGGDLAWSMFQTLSEGFAGLGNGLHMFAYKAGLRKGEYDREILRPESEGSRRGAFDVIFPQSSP